MTIALKKLATSDQMLRSMAGKNLNERCVLLHRAMPDIRIKRTTLSRIYKEKGIKKKVICKVKKVPNKSQPFCDEAIQYCKNRIKELFDNDIPVIFADESCLTTKLLPTREWMNKCKNIEIDEKKLNASTCAFVVGLSKDKGLVAL